MKQYKLFFNTLCSMMEPDIDHYANDGYEVLTISANPNGLYVMMVKDIGPTPADLHPLTVSGKVSDETKIPH